jgi:hypothetical protein
VVQGLSGAGAQGLSGADMSFQHLL